MANLCYNHIVFEGPAENLESLIKYLNKLFWTEEHGHPKNDNYLRLEELVEPALTDQYHTIIGTNCFDVSILEYDGKNVLKSSFERQETETHHVVLGGESNWSPAQGMVGILCIAFRLTATYDYEESSSFYGRAKFDHLGIYSDTDYTFWEGIAALDPNDYKERAQGDLEGYETWEEFSESDIWNYCPEGLQEELKASFLEQLEKEES